MLARRKSQERIQEWGWGGGLDEGVWGTAPRIVCEFYDIIFTPLIIILWYATLNYSTAQCGTCNSKHCHNGVEINVYKKYHGTHIHTHTCTHTCTHTSHTSHTHMHTQSHTCTYITHTHTHAHTHHTHTCTHNRTHAHTSHTHMTHITHTTVV